MTRETSASRTMVSTTGDGLASHEHDDPDEELKEDEDVCRLSTHLSPFLFTSSLEDRRDPACREQPWDTAVEVRPADPASKADVTAAEQTRVAYSDGRLTVKGPKGWRSYSGWGGWRESIDVENACRGIPVRGRRGIGRCAARDGWTSSASSRAPAGFTPSRLDQQRSAPDSVTST